MRFIFSTGSLWPYGISRCFAFAAAAGFDGMEIMVDQRWDTRQAAYLSELAARHELPVVAVHSPFSASVPGWPQGDPGRIEKSVELAEALGAEVVVHHLPERVRFLGLLTASGLRRFPLPSLAAGAEYGRWLQGGYRALQQRTAVKLCIENMPAWRRFGRRWHLYRWNRPEAIGQFPNLTLDTTHLGTWGLEPSAVYPRLQGRVRHVHLSNYDGREHRRPESGTLQLAPFLKRLAADGYDGAVCLELLPDALEAGADDEAVVGHLATSLAWCRASLPAAAPRRAAHVR